MIELMDIAKTVSPDFVRGFDMQQEYEIDGERVEPIFAHRMWDVCNDVPIVILAIFATIPGKFKAVNAIAKAVLENREAEYTDAVKERVAQLSLEDKLRWLHALALII